MHGLLIHKKNRIPMKKKKFGDPYYPPKNADFGWTLAKMGHFSQKALWHSFEFFRQNSRRPLFLVINLLVVVVLGVVGTVAQNP